VSTFRCVAIRARSFALVAARRRISLRQVRQESAAAGRRAPRKWKERFADVDNDRGWQTIDALNAIAKSRETSVSAVALAWLLAKPAVTSVIFGARSLAQLDDNLKAADVKLSAEDVQKLDDASAVRLAYPYNFIANIRSAGSPASRAFLVLEGRPQSSRSRRVPRERRVAVSQRRSRARWRNSSKSRRSEMAESAYQRTPRRM